MIFKKAKFFFTILGQAVAIASIVIISVCPLSCKITPEGVDVVGGEYESPKLNKCSVTDQNHIKLEFSQKVKLTAASITEIVNDTKSENVIDCKILEEDENGVITVELMENTKVGKDYVITGVVEDNTGNTLTFSSPFQGYNKGVPRLIITDIQPYYSGSKGYKNEYVKFIVAEDGNLFGLVVGSGHYGEKLDFHSPAIDVKKGDKIVVHLRNKGKEENKNINELNDNLNESTALNSYNNCRDLWSENEDPVLHNYKDVVYLKDSINNKLIDSFMYFKNESNPDKNKKWPDELLPYLEEIKKVGFFDSVNIEDACNLNKVTYDVPLHRINAEEIENKIINGEEIPFPLKTNKNEWTYLEAKNDPDRIK